MVFITVIFLQLIANHRHRIILNIKDIDKPLEDDVDFKVDSYCIQHQIYIGSIEIYYFKYWDDLYDAYVEICCEIMGKEKDDKTS